MILGLVLGVSVSALAVFGLVGMAVWVAATEQDRHSDQCGIEETPVPRVLR